MRVTDTDIKRAVGLDKNQSQNTKFYRWKKRPHLKELIRLAKWGLLFKSMLDEKAESQFEELIKD